ncbi:MAG TPA: radical SAM protein [Elusimicrobiales bacterium]|nr:radical SAM protein [Elusimicrobiales bacterium]
MNSLTVALNYKCNNACGFCFLKAERELGLADAGARELRGLFADNAAARRYGRLIISGAEATLRRDLPGIARRALEEGGFSAVQLQTNGRRLADAAYCRALVSAGVSEFLVSIHAATPALDARLTGSRESFRQMRAGIRNILACGAKLISNTVVTSLNYRGLPRLARFFCDEGVRACRFWSFLELGNAGQAEYHVRFSAALPRLRAALEILAKKGGRAELSWFPRCLLGARAGLLKNYYSATVISKEFKSRMGQLGAFHCVHSSSCAHFRKTCLGIHDGYRRRFGDERALLSPAGRRPAGAGGGEKL